VTGGWMVAGAIERFSKTSPSSGTTRAKWFRQFTCLLVVFPGLVLSADPPTLEMFYPAGGERGSTNIVSAIGKFDAWPPKFWVSCLGLLFNAETNKGKFFLGIAPDASPGPRLVRLYNTDGASEPRFFVVGETHEIPEIEPNNYFSKPQVIDELPVTINGRLDKNGDVDSFGINLRAGQWLEARVDSYTLMAKLDPVLRLVTTNGQQLAWNHDFITLDPRLVWRAPGNQTVVLQVFAFPYPAENDIRLTGGDAAVYRLHLAVAGQSPDSPVAPTEKEPNNTLENAQQIEMPAMVVGVIGSADDEDRFRFPAKKNEMIEAFVEAASFGSPLDAWLKIEDSGGKELARTDDADGSRDPRLEWQAPSDGAFVVAVGSTTHRGGEEFRYRLLLRPAKSDFRASLTSSSLVLTQGMSNELNLNLKRLHHYTNELIAAFRDLPAGVTATTTNRLQQEGKISFQVAAASDAPIFQGPITLTLMEAETKQERVVPIALTGRTENNGVPGGYTHLLIESIDQLWLTVRPKPIEAEKSTAKK